MRPIAPKPENLAQLVFFIRGEKVMLDAGRARLYGVETGALNRAVKRNLGRFPGDFMFRFTKEDWENLRCQIGVSSSTGPASVREATRTQFAASSFHGGRRGLPYAFTEQGIAMLSSVLRSPRAVQVNIEIMRAFVRLRHFLASHEG